MAQKLIARLIHGLSRDEAVAREYELIRLDDPRDPTFWEGLYQGSLRDCRKRRRQEIRWGTSRRSLRLERL